MLKTLKVLVCLALSSQFVSAQQNKLNLPDSVTVAVHPVYNKVSKTHRWLFGENYRKEWAVPVKMPVFHISKIYGGLEPVKEGGGMQSKSLRLRAKDGKEYVLRSVEKTPDKLLPPTLRNTFAVDWLGDALSSQHPYSALVVPPLADAARVPHSNPVIGVVAEDPALGEYNKTFKGLVCLFEEREPIGESDNTEKMERELIEDNDHRFDKEGFLRARMLDLLMGDWDRHEDQWRWAVNKKGKGKKYTAVPRDRDQVFHVEQGVLPSLAALTWLNPTLDNFDGKIPRVRYSLYKTRFIRPYYDAQFTYDEWMNVVNEFVKAENDQVLEASLKRLPVETYRIRHDVLLKKLKERRDNIPQAMSDYYKFMFNIVDLRTSNKSEVVTVDEAPKGGLRITVQKSDNGIGTDTVFSMPYDPQYTKEIRLYTSNGNDHVILKSTASPIKLRVIGDEGQKTYDVAQGGQKVQIYNHKDSVAFNGDRDRLVKHLSRDTANTKYVPTNLYSVWMPLATASINADDGFLLGVGFRYTHQNGFRTVPYNSMQQLMVTHSFATDAFRVKYNAEWIDVFGKTDIILQADLRAPNNKMNFFGRGNETILINEDNYRRYHRTRFDNYQLDPALRWTTGENATLSFGPSFQYYHLNLDDNAGRFITNFNQLHTYDSLTLNKDKAHLGFLMNYTTNQRNNNILPSKGYFFNVVFQGYEGLNSYSKAYMIIRPEFTYYQKITSDGNVVVSDRIGGGVTIGKSAFYQSLFLGGQGNLLGYLQYRFAGQHMVFNNFQARAKLANIVSYILPGQLGVTGIYDVGRVWINNDNSNKWHSGVGGGLYFSPAGLTILQILAAHSEEGWYPYFSFNFRI